jgi:hypothetical protein
MNIIQLVDNTEKNNPRYLTDGDIFICDIDKEIKCLNNILGENLIHTYTWELDNLKNSYNI